MEPYELLQVMAKLFEALKIPCLVTGSMAYGEPRLTNDIDIVAAVRQEHVPQLVKAFDPEEFYFSEEMIRNAIAQSGQFKIIHSDTGLKVDVMIKKKHLLTRVVSTGCEGYTLQIPCRSALRRRKM